MPPALKFPFGPPVKGLGVPMRTMLGTLIKGSHTVQYPKVKEAPTPRAAGSSRFPEDNCTACMLWPASARAGASTSRATSTRPPASPRRQAPPEERPLGRFDIDFAL
ncbi:MAG: hypothetical protein CM1200mP26_16350 [Acidimicrobiales bacterium]|nr:MAG: hypothetical protein CM1200mP26_16350 [Acidimicrobiales bacterium]